MEEKILSMYAKRMTTGDVKSHLQELYGMDISDSTVSRITAKILPIVKGCQCILSRCFISSNETFSLALFSALIACSPVSAAVPGTAAGSYYYTDIVTYLWNTPVNSINIGGVTLIDAESMSYYGFTVI